VTRRRAVLTAVTFDFWGTLAQDSPETLEVQQALRIRALGDAVRTAGATVTDGDVARGYERSGELMRERFWARHRDPGLREQVALALECCAPGIVERMSAGVLEATVEAYSAPTLLHPPALVPGAAQAVRALAERGVVLAVVSNTGRTPGAVLRRVLERHDLLRYFRTTSYSDEIGCRKPDAEIFRVTLERAGADRALTAHVGDNPVDDVVGARQAGLFAVHFTGAGGSASPEADLAVAHLAELPDRLFRVAS
jgi:putative hydrolase of the HAD superfamily